MLVEKIGAPRSKNRGALFRSGAIRQGGLDSAVNPASPFPPDWFGAGQATSRPSPQCPWPAAAGALFCRAA